MRLCLLCCQILEREYVPARQNGYLSCLTFFLLPSLRNRDYLPSLESGTPVSELFQIPLWLRTLVSPIFPVGNFREMGYYLESLSVSVSTVPRCGLQPGELCRVKLRRFWQVPSTWLPGYQISDDPNFRNRRPSFRSPLPSLLSQALALRQERSNRPL